MSAPINKILIQFDKPNYATDLPEKLGNFFMAPLRQVWGHQFKVIEDVQYVEQLTLSKTARVFLSVVFVVLFPITLPMALAGWVLTALSKTHATSYEACKDYVACLAQPKQPIIQKEEKFKNLYREYRAATSLTDKGAAQENLANALQATPPSQLPALIEDWFADDMKFDTDYLALLYITEETALPALVVQKAEQGLRKAFDRSIILRHIDTLSLREIAIYCRVCGDLNGILGLLRTPRYMEGNEVRFLKGLFLPKMADLSPKLLQVALQYLDNPQVSSEKMEAFKQILKDRREDIDFQKLSPPLITPLLKVLKQFKIDLPATVAETLTPSVVQACLKEGEKSRHFELLFHAIAQISDAPKGDLLLATAFDSLSPVEFSYMVTNWTPMTGTFIMRGSRQLTAHPACKRIKEALEMICQQYAQNNEQKAKKLVQCLFGEASGEQSLYMLRHLLNYPWIGLQAMETLCIQKLKLETVVKNATDAELQLIDTCFLARAQGSHALAAFRKELDQQGKFHLISG